MRLLVIGSGGREHAIGKKLLASPEVSHVFCAKGNAGMTQDGIDVVPIAETDCGIGVYRGNQKRNTSG